MKDRLSIDREKFRIVVIGDPKIVKKNAENVSMDTSSEPVTPVPTPASTTAPGIAASAAVTSTPTESTTNGK